MISIHETLVQDRRRCMDTLIIFILFVKDTISLRKGFPPWISSEFDPEYYISIPSSRSLTVNCNATNGEIRYQWYRNNIKLQSNKRITLSESIGDINFHNLSKEDIGIYHCQAINEYGVSVSLYFKLKEADIGDFSEGKNETKICEENHYCNLTCQDMPHCEPKRECKIEWKMGEGTSDGVKTSKYIMIDRFGTLHFMNISKSDGGKKFTCGVWNKRIKKLQMSRTKTKIIVNEQPDINVNQSTVVFNRDFKALLGEIATLQCIFSENPVLNITWFKNGSIITSNKKYKLEDYNRQLKIQTVTFDDEGEFKCVSESSQTMTLHLNVTSPPIFPGGRRRFLMKYVQYSNLEEIVLQCSAISAPGESDPVVIIWMRNGKSIYRDPSYNFLEENRTLNIPNNNVDEKACYSCVAENSEGLAVANFLLNISRDKNWIIDIRVVISAIPFPLFLVVGGIMLKRIVSRHSKTKSERLQIEESNGRHANVEEHENADSNTEVSDRLYHMPDSEDLSIYNVVEDLNYYSHVSPANDYHIVNHTDDTSVFSSAANDENSVSPSGEYNILGECIPTSTDSRENNTYDCVENVIGIYHTGDQRFNVDTKRSFECDYN